MLDCLIIGSGPAGMTAAIYLARANLKCKILEKMGAGGKMTSTSAIENYPGFGLVDGYELASKMEAQVEELGIEIVYSEAKKIIKNENYFSVLAEEETINAKTLIIATGTTERKLNLESEEAFINKGISFCAICDGGFYKGKDVAVIGGGNSALEEALYLARLCNKVYLVHRREGFRAEDSLVDKVKATVNIELVLNSQVAEFSGVNKLEQIKLNTGKVLKVDGCFEYIGQDANSSLVKEFNVLNDEGFIIVNENQETKIKGLYAAGDVCDKKFRQITTATSDGTIAALSIASVLKD